jgi:6-phosphofructo-2-kinase/fructose-2,6-biphosphatase
LLLLDLLENNQRVSQSVLSHQVVRTKEWDKHQNLFRPCSDVTLVETQLQLNSNAETMPEAAGAVAAGAVADQLLGPREQRQLAIILVGLPAGGKTLTEAKLTRYLRWLGHDTKHFNVGKYRRLKLGSSQSADFFRGDYKEGIDARNEVCMLWPSSVFICSRIGCQIGCQLHQTLNSKPL